MPKSYFKMSTFRPNFLCSSSLKYVFWLSRSDACNHNTGADALGLNFYASELQAVDDYNIVPSQREYYFLSTCKLDKIHVSTGFITVKYASDVLLNIIIFGIKMFDAYISEYDYHCIGIVFTKWQRRI